ncbi:MAG: N-acyl homoserine lactonase family protein [Vicinamibacterales bacterium]
MSRYTIQPVEVGRRNADSALFLYLTDFGVEIEIAYRFWILRGDDGVIVVDTGPPLEEAHRRGITRVRDIDAALAEAGLRGGDVDTIVLTHLHWDHASNAAKFPNAVFLAQAGEIEFFKSATREHPSMNRFFSHHAYLRQLIDDGRIKPVSGDSTIAPGVQAIRVGGHTPGSQMLVVDTQDGTAVVTGDAIPLHRNYTDNIPSGIVVNAVEAIAALERVRALRPVAIYTGHDLAPVLRPEQAHRAL